MFSLTKHPEAWVSVGLAFVGGYADASSYLLAKTFTGHVTGNSILAAISLVNGEWSVSMDRFLAIATFLIGIILSLTAEQLVKGKLAKFSLAITLLLEATIVLVAAEFSTHLQQPYSRELFIMLMCLALGLQNGALQKAEGVSVHTTYVTGMVTTLIKHSFGQLKPVSRRQPAEPRQGAPNQRPPNQNPTSKLIGALWLAFALGAGGGASMVLHFKNFTIAADAFLLFVLAAFQLKISSAQRHS